ncbi:MAG: hypothetical protein P4L41_12410 [Flavipsychrobacter sp.]|nr:hypothetical protein [Flavipsychrobacter sp.]
MDNTDAKLVHDITYSEVEKNVPAKVYSQLTDTSHAYKRKMLNSKVDYEAVLPFYIVKPLYVLSIWFFYKTGVNLPAATILPSVIAYFFIGVLLFYWILKYRNPFTALAASVIILLSGPLLVVAKLSTPDCISALFLFSSIYFIVEKGKYFIAFFFLMLAIFTRIDNIIPAVIIISFLALVVNKISPLHYFIMLLISFICFFFVAYNATRFGWNLMFYPSFFKNNMVTFHKMSPAFSIHNYLSIHISDAIVGFLFSQVNTFMLMGMLAFTRKKGISFRKLTFDQMFLLMILVIYLTRFILHSETADRFYMPYYLVIIMLLVRKLSHFNVGHTEQ